MNHRCLGLIAVALIGALLNFACKSTTPTGPAGGGGYTFQGGVPAQAGSSTGQNQPTLVIFVRASDDATANLPQLRTSEQAEFDQVSEFYDESAYGQLSFQYTFAPANGWYQLGSTYDDYMWTQADVAAETPNTPAWQAAVDGQNLVQDFWGFFTDSMQAAIDDGFNVSSFDQVCVVVVGPFHRGTSYSSTNFTLTDTGGNTFQTSLPVVVVSTNTGWSRTAHEFGHAFGGFADLYNATNRRVGNWDIMDCTDCGAQTTGWHVDKKANWYGAAAHAGKLKTLELGDPDPDVTTLVPLDEASPAGGAVQSLRLDVAPGLYLYVENRRLIPGQTSSQNLPANGIVITDAVDDATIHNTGRPPILLFGGPISSGNTFTDSTYGDLSIAVSGTGPDLQVSTSWGPNPSYDLYIRPWNPPPWESADVWVDSPANGWDTYEFSDAAQNPGVAGNPVRNGDRPRTGAVNRLYARVFNDGNVDASNVEVSFRSTTPSAVGQFNWSLIDRDTLATVPAGGSAIAQIDWKPTATVHSCIKAVITHQPNELNANNNEAQENVSDFDTTSSSPWKPVDSTLAMVNPTDVHQRLRVEMTGLPRGWTGWVSERFVDLAPKARREIRYRIDPGKGGDMKLGTMVDVHVEGWLREGDREIRLGGVTSAIHLVREADLELELPEGFKTVDTATLSDLEIGVRVSPSRAGVPVALVFRDPQRDESHVVAGRTDGAGRAVFNVGRAVQAGDLPPLQPGKNYYLSGELYGDQLFAASSTSELFVLVR